MKGIEIARPDAEPSVVSETAHPCVTSLASVREVFGVDLRTLALFRVLLGGYLIFDLFLRARDLVAHYTDFGVMPRSALIDYLSPASLSLHMASGSAAFQAALFVLAGMFALMMMLGWRTRLATVVSWLLLLSLQNRNTVILSGEDNLVILLMFWAMFLPLGARYAVDSALAKADRQASNAFFSVATMALLIQGMSMYLFSALLKSDAKWVPDGTAVYYALQLDYFATPFALWFRQFEGLLQYLTYYVWALELIGPILMFSPLLHRPLRAVMIAAFMSMHVGFFLCLEIGIFPLISIIMNLTFLPGWVWDGLERRLRARRTQDLRIWYDRDCGFCLKICRLLKTFLFLSDVPLRPAQDDPKMGPLLARHNSWVVSEGTRHHLKWDAVHTLVAASPIIWPVAKAMSWRPFRSAGDWLYLWIAKNRPLLSGLSAAILPWRKQPTGTHPATQILAGLFLAVITVQNLSTLPATQIQLPQSFVLVRQLLGLYQNWTMFAPYPEMNSPWPVINGVLRDGQVVDVYRRRPGQPVFDKPAVVSAVYENYRWRKLLSNLEDDSYENIPQRTVLNYARYLCRTWNTDMPPQQQLTVFTIQFQVEWTPRPGEAKTARTRTIWTHNCFG